jgi:hypothetical protein
MYVTQPSAAAAGSCSTAFASLDPRVQSTIAVIGGSAEAYSS